MRDGYPMRGPGAVGLGEDHQKIAGWIKNGRLQDRLQVTRRHDGSGKNIHGSREKDILDFIRNHPQKTQSRQSRPNMVFGLWPCSQVGKYGKQNRLVLPGQPKAI